MATSKGTTRTEIKGNRVIAGRYKVVKNVTLPLLKLKPNGPPYYVRFESKMFTGEALSGEGAKKMEPATLAHVIDHSNKDAECQIIVPAVMQKELRKAYPNDTYVGKSFELTVTRELGADGNPAKRYNHVGIVEITVNDDE